jgi:hypothetical protein
MRVFGEIMETADSLRDFPGGPSRGRHASGEAVLRRLIGADSSCQPVRRRRPDRAQRILVRDEILRTPNPVLLAAYRLLARTAVP